jgi:hypothetical protein
LADGGAIVAKRSKRFAAIAAVLSLARDREQFTWCFVVDDLAIIVESTDGDGLID